MNAYRLLEVQRKGSAVVARVLEEYLSTGIAADFFASELQQVLQDHQPRILVIDLEQVRMISSSPIGVLLKIRQKLHDEGGQLRLANVAIPIAEVYRTLGLAEMRLPVYDSVQQALALPEIDDEDEDREIMED